MPTTRLSADIWDDLATTTQLLADIWGIQLVPAREPPMPGFGPAPLDVLDELGEGVVVALDVPASLQLVDADLEVSAQGVQLLFGTLGLALEEPQSVSPALG